MDAEEEAMNHFGTVQARLGLDSCGRVTLATVGEEIKASEVG